MASHIKVFDAAGTPVGFFYSTLPAWNRMRSVSDFNFPAYCLIGERKFTYHHGRFTSFQDFINEQREHRHAS
jgi:hypothetical protein